MKEGLLMRGDWESVFQQLEMDYTVGESTNAKSSSPIIHIYGLTREGHSVLVHVRGVLPYFYVPAPHSPFDENDCESFRLALNARRRALCLALSF